MTSLDPPTALERAAAGADEQTAFPSGPRSPPAFARNWAARRSICPPTPAGRSHELGRFADVARWCARFRSGHIYALERVQSADRTNLPPDTVLGFRDVGPSARGPGSSGATLSLSARARRKCRRRFSRRLPFPRRIRATIESIKLTGDLGAYVIQRGTATVGRSGDATIRIDSREMSRIHAILSVTDHEVIVEDRGSINGTSVNGTAISGRRTLVHGDRVCFADFEFRLEVKRTEGHP